MKKLMYFAAALLVLAGCNKKDNALNNAPEGTPFKKGQQVTLSVGTGDNANQAAPRKVAGIDNNTQIDFTWEEGDKILVKVGDATAEFTLSSEPGSAEGEFEGEMPEGGSTFDIQYPVDAPDWTAQEYTTDKPIPADKMLFKATGCILGKTATLKAQYAMLQLNLYGTSKTIGKIVVTDISNIFDNTKPVRSYTLTCGGKEIGADAANATPFYIVVPAGEYKFEVRIWDDAETPAKLAWFGTSTAKTFEAGKCMNMPAKEVKVEHTSVDMGTAGKWATCNVGGVAPEDYGDYFAWGVTSPNTGCTFQTYFDTNDKGNTFTKYYNNGGKTVLDSEDDAAYQNWGSDWRMPTEAELDGLKNNCTWTWTDNYIGTGVKGRIVTNNGNYIFLPAAGYRNKSSLTYVGFQGIYWSSSISELASHSANFLYFQSNIVNWSRNYRIEEHSVRPVCQ